MRKGATTRACIFATVHREATLLLMDMLEDAGLNTMVGKVNMDRNCPDYLREESAEWSAAETVEWIKDVLHKKYKHTRPILTPRFTPSCTDELMEKLKMIQMRYELPLQSHLSENPGRSPGCRSSARGRSSMGMLMISSACLALIARRLWPTVYIQMTRRLTG